MGALQILAENGDHITQKLGFPLHVHSVCSRHVDSLTLPVDAIRTSDWRNVIDDPRHPHRGRADRRMLDRQGHHRSGHRRGQIRSHRQQRADGAYAAPKSGIAPSPRASTSPWKRAWPAAFPIHAVLREGISGDRIQTLYGILNGTCNYILTEMERRGEPFEQILDGGATAPATPKPTRPPTSMAATRDRSSPFCRRSPSESASCPTIFTPKASAASRRSISITRTSFITPFG